MMRLPTDQQAVFERMRELTVLVIGDLMLDRYLWGNVSRLSPEAPVPIVDVSHEENRMGGAANVGLNLMSLGAKPILCGVVGMDTDGDRFLDRLISQHFSDQGILRTDARRTTTKVRVIGQQQQLLRVDREDTHQISTADEAELLAHLLPLFPQADALVFEDYDKGVLTPTLIQALVKAAHEQNLPVYVDPKFRQFWDYTGVTVFKPNLRELNQGLGLHLSGDDHQGLLAGIQTLRERMPHRETLVTLSAAGMLWVDHAGKATHVPAHPRKILDVSGAGDTVISVLALALAAGIAGPQATALANLAGGLVCEEVGVVPINAERLMEAAATLDWA